MPLSTENYGFIIDPFFSFMDDKGKTLKNGFLRVFIAGSSTPAVTYLNWNGAMNQETIQLDNSGRCYTRVIGAKDTLYKVCVYDSHHSQETPIITVDNIQVLGAVAGVLDGSITTVKLADEAVTKDKIHEGAVTDLKLDQSIRFNRSSSENQKGYCLLDGNTSLSEQIVNENTIYEIRWNFVLDNDENIIIPAGCILKFNGGSLSNGKLTGNNTQVVAGIYQIFHNVDFEGTFVADEPRCEWFGGGAIDSISDNSLSVLSCVNAFGKVKLNRGAYKFTNALALPDYAVIEGEDEGLTSFELYSDIDFISLSEIGVILRKISFNVRTESFSHKVITIYGKSGTQTPRVFSQLNELKFVANFSYSLQFDGVAISLESNAYGITEIHMNEIYTYLFGVAFNFATQTNGWINENKFTKIYVRSCPCAVKMRLTGTNTQIISNHFDISYQNDVNFYRATQNCIIDVPVNNAMVMGNTFNGFFWDVRTNPDSQAGGVLKSVGFNSFGTKRYFSYQSGTDWNLLALVPNKLYGVAFDLVVSVYYNVKYRFQFTTVESGGESKLVCNKVENLTSKAFVSQFEFKYIVRNDTIYLFYRKTSEGYFYSELDGQGAASAPYASSVSSLPDDNVDIVIPDGNIVHIYDSQTLLIEGKEKITGVLEGVTSFSASLSTLYTYATNSANPSGIRIYRTTASSLGLSGTELIILFVHFAGNAYGGSYGAGSSFIGFGGQAIYRGKIDLSNQTWAVTKMDEVAV